MAFTFALVLAALFASTLSEDISDAQKRFNDVNVDLYGQVLQLWYGLDPRDSQVLTAIPYTMTMIQLARVANDDVQKEVLELLNQTSLEDAVTIATEKMQYWNKDTDAIKGSVDLMAIADNSNVFTDRFKQGFTDIFGGTVQNMDFSDGASVASAVIDFLQGENYRYPIVAENFTTSSGLVLATKVVLEFQYSDAEKSLRPYKQVDVEFKGVDGTQVTKSGWYCEGYGKYAYIEEYDVEIIVAPLKAGYSAVLVVPGSGSFESVLQYIHSAEKFAAALARTEEKYLKFEAPLPLKYVDTRDDVPEAKMTNLMPHIFDEKLGDGLEYLFESGSSHVSNMFYSLVATFDAPTQEQTDSVSVEPDFIIDRPLFYSFLDDSDTPVVVGMLTV